MCSSLITRIRAKAFERNILWNICWSRRDESKKKRRKIQICMMHNRKNFYERGNYKLFCASAWIRYSTRRTHTIKNVFHRSIFIITLVSVSVKFSDAVIVVVVQFGRITAKPNIFMYRSLSFWHYNWDYGFFRIFIVSHHINLSILLMPIVWKNDLLLWFF